MFQLLLRAAAPFAILATTPLAAQPAAAPITAGDLMRHIQILASDDYQGRAPGSEGERLTTDYIVRQFQARGLGPAGESGTWFQPVRLVETVPGQGRIGWTVRGAPVEIAAGDMAFLGDRELRTVTDAPVVFAGYGTPLPTGGADLHGAVALILGIAPPAAGLPPLRQRVKALADAGAAAVVVIAGADLPWDVVSVGFSRGSTRLDAEPLPPLAGIMPESAVRRLLTASGGDFGRLLDQPPGPSFRPVALPVRVSMAVHTQVRRFATSNVIGRLRGSGASGESVMLLAHWDHFGLCRPAGAPDRICNGAVDNASGVAMMIEVAGHIARGPRPARDLLALATTAEEEGLLGAEYFATHPTVPLDSIAAAVNLDTVAIAPAGEPVAILNRDIPGLTALVEATATAMGRRIDTAHEADMMAGRQDGAALARHGVPAFMVGGSFASMARLNAFLEGRYHKPDDQADGQIVLDGAAEDANLLVALGLRLADPAVWTRPQRVAQ